MKRKLLSALLALSLTFSLSAAPAAALTLDEARQLLRDHYVDQIPESVLSLDSLDEILAALGDPYTYYMTAEQYEQFTQSVNGETLVGVGITVQTAYDDGFLVLSILPNSPAKEAGLQAGDRIIAVDGVDMTATTDVRSTVTGKEGSTVTLTIRRSDGQVKEFTMQRRTVVVPIVTYDKQGSAGVIECISFGDSTGDTIEEALTKLEPEVSAWIMDLRSNPGGDSDAAAVSAGLFVGSDIMVYFRDANGNYRFVGTTQYCPDLTDKPLIILTSDYSASGAELFSADARDLGFGIAIGQTTFGKGIAQMIYNSSNTEKLFDDGDAMKITVYRFYSPDGATNQWMGVIPTLVMSKENTKTAAMLLTQPEPSRNAGYYKLELAGWTFYISRDEALSGDNRAAFTELLEALPPSAALYEGERNSGWNAVAPAKLADELGLSFHARTFADTADSPFSTEIDTLSTFGLLEGYEDGTFRPEAPITRAEFCAMLANVLGLPQGQHLSFSDVADDAWYTKAVSAMAARGFVSGVGDGTFRPDDTITYEQMTTILSSVAVWASMSAEELNGKTDISLADYQDFSPWAQRPAWIMDQLGALVGDLQPQDLATRETAAGMLYAMMDSLHMLWQ